MVTARRYYARTPRRGKAMLSHRTQSKSRREQLAAAHKCINGPAEGSVGKTGVEHGPVVRGNKCQRCIDVHAKTADKPGSR